MRSALMIEGELPKDGLAALEGDGDDVLLTLARRLAEQSADAGQSLEGLFAHAQDINGADSDFLVDSDWESAVSSPEAGSTHGGVADPWQAVFDDGAPSHSAHSAGVAGASSGTPGRVVSFEEFGRLVRRPKRRRRPVPEGQLTLFNV